MTKSFLMALAAVLIILEPVFADEYHYQDLIVGERAAGLAGAYVAIADDPSGLYHNPAGIIYNFENYFSLSANVYKMAKTTFKKAIAGQDYTMESSGWVPNFFGATQNYGKWKYGFAILSPSNEVLDLDDNIADISAVAGETKSVRRRYFRQYSVSMYGVGAALEPVKDFALGMSLFLGQLTDKRLNTQLQIFNAVDASSKERYALNESFNDQSSLFLNPRLGIQWMPAPQWSVGAVVSGSYTLYSKQKIRVAGAKLESTGKLPTASNNDVDYLSSAEGNYKPNVLGPYELGLGFSYFPSKSLLFTTDVKYYTADSSFTTFDTLPVLNLALGAEYFFSDKIIVRGGFYTNNANTKPLASGSANQESHVDIVGATASISFANPGSSFTICTQLGQGSGKGQILQGSTSQQDVESVMEAVYITASYQL